MHSHPALRFSQLLLLVATFMHATRIPTLPYLPAEMRVWDASCARHCVQSPSLMAHNPCGQPDLRGEVALGHHIQGWGSSGLTVKVPTFTLPYSHGHPCPWSLSWGVFGALTLPSTPQYRAQLPFFNFPHPHSHFPWQPLLDSAIGQGGGGDTRLSLHHTPTTHYHPHPWDLHLVLLWPIPFLLPQPSAHSPSSTLPPSPTSNLLVDLQP